MGVENLRVNFVRYTISNEKKLEFIDFFFRKVEIHRDNAKYEKTLHDW